MGRLRKGAGECSGECDELSKGRKTCRALLGRTAGGGCPHMSIGDASKEKPHSRERGF
jgi:hypothetical protein